jgi:hypothetical protein
MRFKEIPAPGGRRPISEAETKKPAGRFPRVLIEGSCSELSDLQPPWIFEIGIVQ